MDRRDFLKVTGACAAASMMPEGMRLLFAQEKGRSVSGLPVLVSIYQRGGMDAINALVPHGDKRYRDIRPTIGIPAADGDEGKGMVKLDGTFGLHPSMASLKPWWDAKKLAPVVNAGSPHETRSHFDAQDFMEYAAPGSRTTKMGWLNRFLKASTRKGEEGDALRAVAMQGLLPRALRGEVPVLAVPDRSILNNEKVLDTFGELYGEGMTGRKDDNDPVVQAGQDTLETLNRYKKIVGGRSGDRKTKYPAGRTAQQLRDVASLIHADTGLQVAAIDIGGWDHHANEGGNEGTLATMLQNLSESLSAFATDLGAHLDRTLVVVMTEFGRTCRENGNRGTDHGHGGVMWLLGGAVKGGKVHGEWRGLDDKVLYQGRDLPVTVDFRDVFTEALRSHMKFDLPKDFFPDYRPSGVKGLF